MCKFLSVVLCIGCEGRASTATKLATDVVCCNPLLVALLTKVLAWHIVIVRYLGFRLECICVIVETLSKPCVFVAG